MLSRTASNLYWMARHMERAENITRLLDVSYNMSLMPSSAHGHLELAAPLTITGRLDQYYQKHDWVDTERLMDFFVFDESNDGSIYRVMQTARDNAHGVRDKISSEAWESINATSWIELRSLKLHGLKIYGVKRFFDWVRQRSHEFRGAAYGTMLRNDAFHFLRVGAFIERADNTARILDVKYQVMSHAEGDNKAVDFYQWNSLLQSLSAYEAYHDTYAHGMSKRNVAELLILSPNMPRSLRYCMGALSDSLGKIEGKQGLAAQRLTAELAARLNYGAIDYILDYGLHEYINDLLRRIHAVGEQIHRSYWEGA